MRKGKRRVGKRKGPVRRVATGKCHYCNAPATTKDHIWPKALGGTNGLWNLVGACVPCNSTKGHAIPTCQCRKCRAAAQRGREIGRRAGLWPPGAVLSP